MADEYEKFNDIIKRKIESIRDDIEKLKAVDDLIGKDATESKKLELINIIFALQDIQVEAIDMRESEQMREMMMRLD